jgi:dimethylglycine dehydrogenase
MTITRLSDDQFYVVTPAVSEVLVLQHMEDHLPVGGSVTINNVTTRLGVLTVIGPKSRDLLARITEADLSNEQHPYLSCRNIHIGVAPVRAIRMNFAGELGWELHHDLVYQRAIYSDILRAGREFGLVNCGLRAVLNSLRLEKGFHMAADFSEATPLEAGLEAFVNFKKDNFIGREALLRQKEQGIKSKLVMLDIDADDADAYGDECIWCNNEAVGRITSGGRGHRIEKSLAFGFVKPELSSIGTRLEVEILDVRRPAVVVKSPCYDPENRKVRA